MTSSHCPSDKLTCIKKAVWTLTNTLVKVRSAKVKSKSTQRGNVASVDVPCTTNATAAATAADASISNGDLHASTDSADLELFVSPVVKRSGLDPGHGKHGQIGEHDGDCSHGAHLYAPTPLTIDHPGADDVLPLLILTVKHSNPENLFSELKYLNTYLEPSQLDSEGGYLLTQFASAVKFLENADSTVLSISPSEFESSLRRCRLAANDDLEAVRERHLRRKPRPATTTGSGPDGASSVIPVTDSGMHDLIKNSALVGLAIPAKRITHPVPAVPAVHAEPVTKSLAGSQGAQSQGKAPEIRRIDTAVGDGSGQGKGKQSLKDIYKSRTKGSQLKQIMGISSSVGHNGSSAPTKPPSVRVSTSFHRDAQKIFDSAVARHSARALSFHQNDKNLAPSTGPETGTGEGNDVRRVHDGRQHVHTALEEVLPSSFIHADVDTLSLTDVSRLLAEYKQLHKACVSLVFDKLQSSPQSP
jgi:Vacuolar sorting protein 9 (VPS9) domain